MLKTRVLTALVLLAAFIPAALFLPDRGWAVLISAVIGVAAWEWAGLAGFGKKARVAYGFFMFASLAALAWLVIEWFAIKDRSLIEFLDSTRLLLLVFSLSALVFWFVLVPLWFRFRWQLKGLLGLVVGALVLVPAGAYVAICDDQIVLLSVLAIAWVADTAAYFAGRKFGKRKLAPGISPGKTWEGAAGAFVAVFLYCGAFFYLFSAFSQEVIAPALVLLCTAFALTAACILGDLFESLLKRQAGVKDSSNLLPGHGGVLDRIDSLLALLPILLAVTVLAVEVLVLSGILKIPS